MKKLCKCKSINITDNNDNKSNYDYYRDKLKKSCSYL